MSRRTATMCRRIARRAAPDDVTFPMTNYPYSTPSLPGRQTLADMVLFYGSAELRSRIRADRTEDEDLLSDLVDQVIDLVGTWTPTTEWHMMSVVRTGRTVEWLVWQVATAADDELGPMYREDTVIPFAIDLESLPRYPLLPTLLVHPDDID
jgi:hypothetical protein